MSERPAKRRRVELSLDDKVKIINKYETLPKPTLQSLSDSFGIGKSTVSNIIKKRDTYKSQYENNANGSKRRFNNACKFDRLNELVWQWFLKNLSKPNTPLNRTFYSVPRVFGLEKFHCIYIYIYLFVSLTATRNNLCFILSVAIFMYVLYLSIYNHVCSIFQA